MQTINGIKEQKKRLMIISFRKLLLQFLLLFGFCTVKVFATTNTIAGLDDSVTKVTDLIKSPWLTAVAGAALAIEGGALLFAGRNEPGLIKKFLPWIVGTIVIGAAPAIATYLYPTAT